MRYKENMLLIITRKNHLGRPRGRHFRGLSNLLLKTSVRKLAVGIDDLVLGH